MHPFTRLIVQLGVMLVQCIANAWPLRKSARLCERRDYVITGRYFVRQTLARRVRKILSKKASRGF